MASHGPLRGGRGGLSCVRSAGDKMASHLVLLVGGLLRTGKSLYHKLIAFHNSSFGLHAGMRWKGSGVVECLEEWFECGRVRIQILLVIPPAAHCRSVKRLFHVRMGR